MVVPKKKRKVKAMPRPGKESDGENFVIIDSSYLVFYRFYATI